MKMGIRRKTGLGVFIGAVFFLSFHIYLLKINPFVPLKVTNPSMAVSARDGSKIVVDESGRRFFMVNQDEKICFIKNGNRENRNTFYDIRDLITDKAGNIYILDIRRMNTGRRIESERILKYSPGGKFLEVFAQMNYGEEPVLKNNIYKLDLIDDTLIWFQFTEEGYKICRETGGETQYLYDDAANMIVDFSVNPVTGRHGFLTKTGDIYEETQNREFKQVYSVKGRDGYVIPWDLVYDSKGDLYYADIGQRAIYRAGGGPVLQNNSLAVQNNVSLEEIKKYPIYYNLSIESSLVTTDTYGIGEISQGEYTYSMEYRLDFPVFLRCAAAWLCLGVCFFYGIYLLRRLAYYLQRLHSVSITIIAGLVAGTLVMTVLFSMVIMKDWNERMTAEMFNRISGVSKLSADLVPADKLDTITCIGDYMSRDYKELRNTLREIFLSKSRFARDLYCAVYKIQDGMVTLAYTIEDYTGAVYPYDWPYEGADEEIIMREKVQKFYTGLSTADGSFLFVLSPIVNDEGKSVGIMEVGTDSYAFRQDNRNMILQVIVSALVMAVTIVLIIFEVLEFIEGKKKLADIKKSGGCLKKEAIPVEMTRIFVFIIFFITNMTTGFLPIYLMKLAQAEKQTMISPEILVSLAMSAEVLSGAAASFGGNVIIRFLGRRKTAVLGSVLFAAGLSVRAVFPSVFSFIAGNAVMGAGWGVLLLIVQIMLAEREEEEKTKGFTGYTQASLSGVNCGVVFGAFLINWLSYQAVLRVIGVLSLGTVIFSVLYIQSPKVNKQKLPAGPRAQREQPKLSTAGFLLSPEIFLYFAGIVLPVVAGGSFLSYLYPVLAKNFAVSETDIGYSYLLNGLCIICLGNVLTSYFVKRFKQRLTLVFSLLLYAGAFTAYALFPSMLTLLAALVLLGLSDGFGLPVQGTYYTSLKRVEMYGYDKAMGIFSLFENMAQVGGSFLFGIILMKGVGKGLFIAGIGLVLLAFVFLVLGKEKMKGKGVKELE